MTWQRMLKCLFFRQKSSNLTDKKTEEEDSVFKHTEDTIKVGDRYLAFLKSELDRQIARSRLFESRAQVMATFAGAGATLAALTKPTDINTAYIFLLACTALLTVTVIATALRVHANQDITLTNIDWYEAIPDRIWSQEETPMELIHELELAQIRDIKDAMRLADVKSKRVDRLQILAFLQLLMVAVTICTAAFLGGAKQVKAHNVTAAQPAAIQQNSFQPSTTKNK